MYAKFPESMVVGEHVMEPPWMQLAEVVSLELQHHSTLVWEL